jgi:cytochrome c nitrite reductase small subunit
MDRFRPYALAALIGVMGGLGLYTFVYAQGFSYFSNNPEACANCHVMRDFRDAWQRGSHHAQAACNDCHTPHPLASKYIVKARNGWNHSLRFTLQNFPDPIRIRPANAGVLEANCIRCHREMVSEMAGLRCVRCHAGVGHDARPGTPPRS